jgi:uncharacterized protein (TIGR00255 family)
MTGFGSAKQALIIDGKLLASVHVDCRSVNGRFLDLTIRSPEEVRSSEGAIRELIAKRINRGKLEFRINLHREPAQENSESARTNDIEQRFNQSALTELQAMSTFVKERFPSAGALSVSSILQWPGILLDQEIPADQLHEVLLNTCEEALESLLKSRSTEGVALSRVILDRIQTMEEIVGRLEPLIPELIKQYQGKLTEKITSVLDGVDAQGRTFTKDELTDRVRQEVVLYGVRIDVAEEMSRLKTHFAAVRSALAKGGPVGKRLDFLMQELQRESNTLGSKSVSQEASDASVELKLLVEQIREQVQNLE